MLMGEFTFFRLLMEQSTLKLDNELYNKRCTLNTFETLYISMMIHNFYIFIYLKCISEHYNYACKIILITP